MSKKENVHKEYTMVDIVYREDAEYSNVMFVKQHKIKNMYDNTILLVLNVPTFCDQNCLKEIFSGCGKVMRVFMQEYAGKIENWDDNEEENSFNRVESSGKDHVAYIKFDHPNAVDRALKMCKTTNKIVVSNLKSCPPLGITKFCLDYMKSIPFSVPKLQKEIDDYMEAYDKKKEEEERKEAEKEGVPDEDGWITVTTKGRNPGFTRSEANQKKLELKKDRKRRQENDLFFYEYKRREKQHERVAEMRKKFEEDKRKVAEMREQRKFRPF